MRAAGRASGLSELRARPGARIVLPLLIALEVVALAYWTRENSFDDAYITYSIAASFADGWGLTWNGAPVLGTTSPLYALLIGCAERALPLGAPVWGWIVYWCAVLATSLLLFAPAGAGRTRLPGAAAAALYPLVPLTTKYIGSEMALATLLVVAAVDRVAREGFVAAAILGALACCVRPDFAVLVSAIAAVTATRRPPVREIGRAAAAAAATIAAWAVTVQLLTGHLIPRSLAAKRAQAATGMTFWPSGLSAVGETLRELLGNDPSVRTRIAWLVLVACAIAVFLRARSEIDLRSRLLLVGAAAHLGALILLRVSLYPWYFAPVVLGAVVLVTRAMLLAEWLPRGRWIASLALCAALLVALRPGLSAASLRRLDLEFGNGRNPRVGSYTSLAHQLLRYPASSTIAYWEMGVLGWETRRPIRDLLGLVNEVPFEAVSGFRLDAVRRALDPDLLVVRLRSPRFAQSVLGDLASFHAEYRLDHLQLEPISGFMVFRKRGDGPRGEVALDLLPELGSRMPLELLRDRRRAAPAVKFESGSELRLRGIAPGGRFCWLDLGQPGAIEVRAGSAPAIRSGTAEPLAPGSAREFRLGCTAPAGSDPEEIRLRCLAPGETGCRLALPHLRWSEPLEREWWRPRPRLDSALDWSYERAIGTP